MVATTPLDTLLYDSAHYYGRDEKIYSDNMYKLSKNLSFDEIHIARQKDFAYNNLFFEERFKNLLREKSHWGLLEQILQNNNGFLYQFSTGGKNLYGDHFIQYLPNPPVILTPTIRESIIIDTPGNYSLLKRLYGTNAMYKDSRGAYVDGPNYRLVNVGPNEVRRILEEIFDSPLFDVAKLSIFTE